VLLHLWSAGPDHCVSTDDIDPVDVQEILGRESFQIVVGHEFRVTSVVDQEMYRSKFVDTGLGKSSAVFVLSNIGSTKHSFPASLLDQPLCLVGTIDRFCVLNMGQRAVLGSNSKCGRQRNLNPQFTTTEHPRLPKAIATAWPYDTSMTEETGHRFVLVPDSQLTPE
jgi:hypothetical protein